MAFDMNRDKMHMVKHKYAFAALAALATTFASAATLTVTSTGDDASDPATLRGAIAAASDGDTITFDAELGGRNPDRCCRGHRRPWRYGPDCEMTLSTKNKPVRSTRALTTSPPAVLTRVIIE